MTGTIDVHATNRWRCRPRHGVCGDLLIRRGFLAATLAVLALAVSTRSAAAAPFDLGTIGSVPAGLCLLAAAAVAGVVFLISHQRQRALSQQLQQADQQLQTLLTFASDWYWETDAELRFTRLSSRRESVIGHSNQEMIGRRSWDRFGDQPLPPEWQHHKETLESHLPFKDFEYEIPGADGKPRLIQVSGEPVFTAAGVFSGYRGIASEVTAQRLVEQALEESEKRYRHTFEAAPVGIAHIRASDGKWLRFNARLLDILGYSRTELEQLSYAEIIHPDDKAADEAFIKEAGAGEIEIDGAYREIRYIHKNGGTVWVGLTTAVARDAAGVPDYYITIFEDITARKVSEAALRASEERFRQTFELAPVGVGHTSAKDRSWLRFNNKMLEITGYTREEFQQLSFNDLTHPDDRATDDEVIGRLHAGEIEAAQLEKRYVRKDGEIRWVSLITALVRDAAGEPDHYISLIEDITERKQSEAALRESEERFRHTFELAPVGIVNTNPEGVITRLNDQVLKITGYSPDELYGRSFMSITHPDDRDASLENTRRLIDGEVDGFQMEKRYLRKDGSVAWVNTTVSLVRDGARDPVYFIAILEDITERKQAESARRLTEERFQAFWDNSPFAQTLKDVEGRVIAANDSYFETYGFDKAATLGQRPQERGAGVIGWLEAINSIDRGVLESGQPVQSDVQVCDAAGKQRDMRLTKFPVYDGDGKIVAVGGIAFDITAQLRAQKALAESEGRFRAFWDNAPFSASVKDLDGRFVSVNARYLNAYDLTEADIIGKTQSEAHADIAWTNDVIKVDRAVLANRKPVQVDVIAADRNVPDRTIRITKFPIFDADGSVAGLGGIGFDTTEQTRARRALEASEILFRLTFEQAAVGIAHTSFDGRWLRVNQRFCDIIGYTQDELNELTFQDITLAADINEDFDLRNKLIAGQIDTYTREKRYIRNDGSIVWTLATASLMPSVGGSEPYVIVIAEDITARKIAEAALETRIRQQATVASLGQLALGDTTVEEVNTTATREVARTLGADACVLTKFDSDTCSFVVLASSLDPDTLAGVAFSAESAQSAEIYRQLSAGPVMIRNIPEEAPHLTSPIIRQLGTRSGASVVVSGSDGSRPYGILAVHSRTEREFTSDDINFLQAIANVLGAKIARTKIQAELYDREQSLNAILDNAAEAIVASDEVGSIVMFNRAAERMFGYAEAEIVGGNIGTLIPQSAPDNDDGYANLRPASALTAQEVRGRRQDGRVFPMQMSTTAVSLPGRKLEVAIMRDVTEQRELQAQLIQASKLASVGEMAAGMAHELNQPLNIMRMAADNILLRMEAGNFDPDYAIKNLNLIGDQASRMGRIILHMRVFSRLDSFDFELFDPAETVRTACELMAQQLRLDNIDLVTDIPAECCKVKGRPSQLEQVVINFISNAQSAIAEHPKNGNDSAIGRLQISVQPNEKEGKVRIVARDSGGGIPANVIDKIFDPFFTTKDVGVGTGLGLSVSYGIVTSMGGTITARNIDDGAEFEVCLPLQHGGH